MEENQKTMGTAVIALLVSIAGFGGNIFLDEGQLDNAYFCEITGEVGIFAGGLSGSEERGYPNIDDRKGYKDCKNGDTRDKWITLIDYAESVGIDPLSLIYEENHKTIIVESVDSAIPIIDCSVEHGCIAR